MQKTHRKPGRPPIRKDLTWEDIGPKDKLERMERVLVVLNSMTPHEVEKHFDMGSWANKTACGTIACAAGHCALDPWFRRRGFSCSFEKLPFEKNGFFFQWDKMRPVSFFGLELYDAVFINPNFMNDDPKKDFAAVKSKLKEIIKRFKKDNRQELQT